MVSVSVQYIGTALFGMAVLHTFCTKWFHHLAVVRPRHAGILRLLGEVEVVFGFWAMLLFVSMLAVSGFESATHYIDTRDFTEPIFVFAIMVIAGTRPITETVARATRFLSMKIPIADGLSFHLVALSLIPLLGSFITEPAAMTLAAMVLGNRVFGGKLSLKAKYATLGTLFVNVSVGGTLTPFAAPPVLMVAKKWGWDLSFMASTFGWKSAIIVVINALAVTYFLRNELRSIEIDEVREARRNVPGSLVAVHILFLVGVVVFSHHPAVFIGLLLFFLGVTQAYPHHQDRLILREGMLVAFFLAGLVVLGGQQQWWLKPLLLNLSDTGVYFGATGLTAFTDNAALTYLGSQVDGLTDSFKYALVAGAVTGGGLTVIANAPNPAGMSILREHFDEGSVSPLKLFVAALLPTLVAVAVFSFL